MAEESLRVLKDEADCFAVFDRYGEIANILPGEEGVYEEGTRFLSHLELRLNEKRPLLLGSHIQDDNSLFSIHLTNPDFKDLRSRLIPRASLHLKRSLFLKSAQLFETIKLQNYSQEPIFFSLDFQFAADFKDIFEIRGIDRKERGIQHPEKHGNHYLIYSYTGLDKIERETQIFFSSDFQEIKNSNPSFIIHLEPKESFELYIKYRFVIQKDRENSSLAKPKLKMKEEYSLELENLKYLRFSKNKNSCRIETSNNQFNRWIRKSHYDLQMLISSTEYGDYPYAGIPWFNTSFGRDGIITGLQTLWINPNLTKDILEFLCKTQARETSVEKECQYGKILHERRKGELSNLREIPFSLYYGSIDATPLFVVLASRYFFRTGNTDYLKQIWSNIEMALQWIDQYGDIDKDGFVEYERQNDKALVNQAWKDSEDSVFHENGKIAKSPLALCEVQAYVYAAKIGAAELAKHLGLFSKSDQLSKEAEDLKKRFNETFWLPDKKTFALALDRNKKACKVKSSNAGQCLAFGIVDDSYVDELCQTLFHMTSFSGWGIRTLDTEEIRYNPVSYHNGSVWPHDNSLIAYGLSIYQKKHEALEILNALFDSSNYMTFQRLPELFCGFDRGMGDRPVLYPISCAPQAWSAGSVFLLLQACLGLEISAPQNQISFKCPVFPHSFDEVQISNLTLNSSQSLDLRLKRKGNDISLDVLNKSGEFEVRLVQ